MVLWYFVRNRLCIPQEFKRPVDIIMIVLMFWVLIFYKGTLKSTMLKRLSLSASNTMYLFLAHLPIIWYVNLLWKKIDGDGYFGVYGGIIQLLIIILIMLVLLYAKNKRHAYY